MRYIYRHTFLLVYLITFFLGYSSVAQDTINVSSQKIPEVQSVAYGNLPSWMVTGAVSSAKGDDIAKSFTTNLSSALHGRISGLNVNQYGTEPGEATSNLYSRGKSTLYSNDVLVIIDGFEGDLENLIPEEIETISLLKDASASVLYGSRAANGVLVVETKRGKKGDLKVNFGIKQGIQRALELPDFLGSYDYARLYNEALENDGKAPLYTTDDLAAYKSGSDPYLHPDVDWYNEVLRKTAPISNYDLNFSGGSENLKYFVLLNILNSQNLYQKTGDISDNSINSKYRRYNFRSNVDIDVLKNLKAIILLAGSVEDKDNPRAINTSNIFWKMSKIAPNAFPVKNPNGTWGGNNIYSNPLGDITETGFYSSNARTIQTVLKLIQNLDFVTKGLSVSGTVSFNNYFRTFSSKTRQYEMYSISGNNLDDIEYTKIGQNTSLAGNENGSESWRRANIEAALNYSRLFNKNELNAMLFFRTDNYKIGNATGLTSFPYRHNDFGGRFTFANSKKYIADFSFGVSGSENFPKGNRYGFFPAVSLGWILSNEDFISKLTWIDNLKLRGSYGMVGNDQIGGQRFMYNETYSYGDSYFLGTSNTSIGTINESNLGNPDLSWEKSKMLNIGIETSIFNCIDASVDVFNEKREDILAEPNATVPGYLGIRLPSLNVGKVNNKGFEAMVRLRSFKKNKFKYTIEGNIWYAKNKIKYYSEVPQEYEWLYHTGLPVGQPFGYEALGFFQSESEIASSPVQNFSKEVKPGDIKYRDMNNDNVIDELDVHAIGNSDIPKITYSFNVNLEYEGFDFGLFFQGVSGRTISLSGDLYKAFQDDGKAGPIALGRWTESTAASATYPRLSSENNQNNFGVYSTYWQRNGSFLKLRNVELGYTVPKKLIRKVGLSNARFFVNGTNLISFDHLDYSDPEISYSGYPPLKTYSIGCKISL